MPIMAELMSDVTREEAFRRFPELNDVRNDELREQAVLVIRDLPGYFWTAPASSSHHPPEHQQRHGLWLHVKRVCTAFERLAPSMVNQGHLQWEDVDQGRVACMLHDMFKYGIPPTAVKHTTDDHDVIAADWLADHTSLPEPVIESVRSHNGPWYEGPPPRSHLQQMVHIADMNASDENARYAVKEPHEVLQDQFPRVAER